MIRMPKFHRLRVTMALLVIVTLVIAGCSRPSQQTPAPQSPQAAQPAAPAPAAPAPQPAEQPSAPATPQDEPAADDGHFDEEKFKDLIAAAQQEGEVVVYYTMPPSNMEPLQKAFTDKFGIRVLGYRAALSQLRERFHAEVSRGIGPDIIATAGLSVFEGWKNDGYLTDYVVSTDHLYPDDWKISGYAYPFNMSVTVLVASPDGLSPEELKGIAEQGWNGLLQPSLKGKVSIPEAGATTTQVVIYHMLVDAYGEQFGEAYLRRLADQNPGIFNLPSLAGERVIQGEYEVGVASETSVVANYLRGAPIQMFYPDPTPAITVNQAISSQAPNPNAARLWMEWHFSREGQELSNEIFLAIPGMPGIEDKRQIASEPWYRAPVNIYSPTDWADIDAKKEDITNVFRTIFNYHP